MRAVESILAERLADGESVFVFPSEVAARYWRRRSLELTEVRAVREDRFLSWDRFKERCFSLTREERPINGIARALFAATHLAENASAKPPLLRAIVHPDFAPNSMAFLRQVVRLLPQLGPFFQALASAERGTGQAGLVEPLLRHDLELLIERYGAFLSANGLFEPAGETIDISGLDRPYYLFFPEVLEDYHFFEASLASPSITVVPIPPAPAADIVRFDSALQEIRALCVDLGELLDGGVPVEEIAVTVPDLKGWAPHLTAEAASRGLPLDFREGRPLADYPACRLFAAIASCESEGYSLDSVKALALDHAIPWRDRATLRELVRFGAENQCLRPFGDGGRVRDPWRTHLERLGEHRLLAAYSRLRRELSAIVAAPSAAELSARILAFSSARLDANLWPPESRRVFEYALESLSDFADTAASLVGVKAPSPFALWRSHLEERIYVQRSAVEGIAVLPYRVSAGIGVRHHFLVGGNQASTRVDWPLLSFLREDERRRLGLVDRSFSEDFLALYAQSGGEVRISFSREDFSGPQLAPGWFVARQAVRDFKGGSSLPDRDGFSRERASWEGGRDGRGRLFRSQRRGMAHVAATAWIPRSSDFTRALVGDSALLARLLDRFDDGEGRLRVSPTSLEGYAACPFAFLVGRLLDVPEPRAEESLEDPRLVGALLHEVLKELFARIRANGRAVVAAQSEAQEGWIDEAIDEVWARWSLEEILPVPPIWRDLRSRARDQIGLLLAIERERFSGYEVGELEESLSAAVAGALLSGKIDRVSYRDGRALVVDYKKHSAPSLREIRGEAGSPPSSFQLPFYVHLLESRGTPVDRAGYYDLQEGKYLPVLEDREGEEGRGAAASDGGTDNPSRAAAIEGGSPISGREASDGSPRARKEPLSREEMAQLRLLLEGRVGAMVAGMRSGDFRAPDSQLGCEPCPLRPICRRRYTVRS